MNDAIKGKDKRVFAYVCVVVVLLYAFNHEALAIWFVELPESLKELIDRRAKLIFIEGNPCTECPSGQYIAGLKYQMSTSSLIFIVPADYTDNDVLNFRRVFSIDGEFVRFNDDIRRTVDKIKGLLRGEMGTGMCITSSPRGKIRKVDLF